MESFGFPVTVSVEDENGELENSDSDRLRTSTRGATHTGSSTHDRKRCVRRGRISSGCEIAFDDAVVNLCLEVEEITKDGGAGKVLDQVFP